MMCCVGGLYSQRLSVSLSCLVIISWGLNMTDSSCCWSHFFNLSSCLILFSCFSFNTQLSIFLFTYCRLPTEEAVLQWFSPRKPFNLVELGASVLYLPVCQSVQVDSCFHCDMIPVIRWSKNRRFVRFPAMSLYQIVISVSISVVLSPCATATCWLPLISLYSQ